MWFLVTRQNFTRNLYLLF